MKTALTIAGSDSSGGAGIQADLKTMTMNGVYAMSVITSLTAQNTTGVSGILDVPADFVEKQIDAVFTDIRPDAVKIGMLSAPDIVRTVAKKLVEYDAPWVVLDPVMVSTSGSKLLQDDAITALEEKLLPVADLITPNIPEAEVLSGLTISGPDDMEDAGRKLQDEYGCAVLCKGGHAVSDANDVLVTDEGEVFWFEGRRIANPNTHGTGCTLSSAIAANLAKGFDLRDSVDRAKEYLSGALAAMLDLGQGSGPMDHAWNLTGRFSKES
ncbi:MAG: bifunctional hydroxymethylpyrimidine kinase/phosphomethylpyrimidine kinase [Acutalibacteraceae bacterium]|nr:bifunctional hydroxymethylpyrimidine kinase/phosphomethylpyrimidine kinase [Acutalibacteraceae bacterium]